MIIGPATFIFLWMTIGTWNFVRILGTVQLFGYEKFAEVEKIYIKLIEF